MPTLLQSKKVSNGVTRLSGRLSAIADCLPNGGVVCDVGSDHGALPLYLLKLGRVSRALVTDLNPLPLNRAKAAISEAGFAHMADFILTDGISEIQNRKPDAYVIAGMGGETIAGILSRGLDAMPTGSYFVLQPMTRTVFLRRFLYENGFRLIKEDVVWENNKPFLIFCAEYDKIPRVMEDSFYFLGEFLPCVKTVAVQKYLKKRLMKLETKINGMRKAGKDVSMEMEQLKELRSRLEDFHEDL